MKNDIKYDIENAPKRSKSERIRSSIGFLTINQFSIDRHNIIWYNIIEKTRKSLHPVSGRMDSV